MEVDVNKVLLRMSDYFCDAFGEIVKANVTNKEITLGGFVNIHRHIGECPKCKNGMMYFGKDLVSLRKTVGALIKSNGKG